VKVPRAAPSAIALFDRLRPTDAAVRSRKLFGQPAAFVNGKLFFGVFGEELFVRLSAQDLAKTTAAEGFRPFEPMPGRPMRGYLILPRPS